MRGHGWRNGFAKTASKLIVDGGFDFFLSAMEIDAKERIDSQETVTRAFGVSQ